MDPLIALVIAVLLLIANGFFVAAEFALVAAKRPRLERAAARGGRRAAAAVAGIRELSLMLAGAQFGITMCTLGLGAVAEPALERLLAPPLHDLGVGENAAHAIAFAGTLALVTFLHMVIGEMAPKSWAITHPERAVLMLAPPFRTFTRTSRPLLAVINGITNALLRLVRVTPRDTLDGHIDQQRLGHLLGESRRLGLIDRHDHELLGRVITVSEATIDPLVVPAAQVTAVPADATRSAVRRAAAASGHARLPVRGADGSIVGIVHLRDAITAPHDDTVAAELVYPVPVLRAGTTVLEAVSRLQRACAQLAVVNGPDGSAQGIVSLDDLLGQLLATNPH